MCNILPVGKIFCFVLCCNMAAMTSGENHLFIVLFCMANEINKLNIYFDSKSDFLISVLALCFESLILNYSLK